MLELHARRVATLSVRMARIASRRRACASSRSAGCCTTWASSPSAATSCRSRGRWTTTSSRKSGATRRRAPICSPGSAWFSCDVRRLVLDHHERLDGSGYPRRQSPRPASTSRRASWRWPTFTTRSVSEPVYPAGVEPRSAATSGCCATAPACSVVPACVDVAPAWSSACSSPRLEGTRRRRAGAGPRGATRASSACGSRSGGSARA